MKHALGNITRKAVTHSQGWCIK